MPTDKHDDGGAVTAESATVYRARGGRRYFSKRAAYFGAAFAMMREKCQCMEDAPVYEVGYPGGVDPCKYHDGSDYKRRLAMRMIRAWKSAEKRRREEGA